MRFLLYLVELDIAIKKLRTIVIFLQVMLAILLEPIDGAIPRISYNRKAGRRLILILKVDVDDTDAIRSVLRKAYACTLLFAV